MLVASGIDAQRLSCYGGYEDLPLRWAEAIPIWYLQKYITNGLCICLRRLFTIEINSTVQTNRRPDF